MNRCNQCGIELLAAFTLCPHHYLNTDAGWATTNRIMCDFVHRGLAPAPVPPASREDELGRCLYEAA